MTEQARPIVEAVDAGPQKHSAGGIPAVLSTARHTLSNAGLIRGVQALLGLNQLEGFDCPGCAWPDPKHRSFTEFCENGAKAVADEATSRRVTPEFFRELSIEELAAKSDRWLNSQGRLTHPMVKIDGASHYEPIAWDDAFERIATKLATLAGPNEAIFYTSGRTSNEAAFLYQLFVRQFGTNNMPDCSNMCHESSGTGLGEQLGIGKGTVLLEDFDAAQLILVFGQNPGTNHPRMLTALQAAARNGATIVSINPLSEPGLERFKHPQELLGLVGAGTKLASLHLPVRINGDVPLLLAVMKRLVERDAETPCLDRAFIQQFTSGFEDFRAALAHVDLEAAVEQCGVSLEDIDRLTELVATSERIIATWAMGLTQHKNGVSNIQQVTNLLLLRGAMGKPGAGACPVRGHSNVQGDRTMGIVEKPGAAFLDKLAEVFDFAPPREPGFDTVEAIEAMHQGKGKVFFALGGNFLSASPDTQFTASALRRCELTVQVSTKLNRSHLVTGKEAIILPCLGRTELDDSGGEPRFVTVENSMGIVHRSQGRLKPASDELLSEPAIVARLAQRTLGAKSGVDWELLERDYDQIRDLIARVIAGFEDFNARVREPHGFALPNAVRDERRFATSTGKARFMPWFHEPIELAPGDFLMMTIRSHDQYNTTIYADNDRYRGITNERRVVLMNRGDMEDAGLVAGQKVDLAGTFAGERRVGEGFLVVAYDIPSRCVATYFPEANVLVPIGHKAVKSGTPASKSVVVRIEPCTA